jgi:hypothetical protein
MSCSDLSGSSSLGQDIVNDVDPNLTNFDRNFSTFSDSAIAVQGFSVGTPVDTSRSYSNTSICVGQNLGQEARSTVLFTLDTTFKNKRAKDTLKSIAFQLDTFTINATDTVFLKTVTLFEYNDYNLTDTMALDSSKSIAVLNRYTDIANKISFKDTLTDSSKLFVSISNALKTKDTLPSNFRFLIASKDKMTRLKSTAVMILTFKRDTVTITDTLAKKDTVSTLQASTSNYVIFSNSSLNAELDQKPVTSTATGRKAAFPLCMTKFWDSLNKNVNGTNYKMILSSAHLSLKATVQPSEESSKVIPFRYHVSSTRFNDQVVLRDSIDMFETTNMFMFTDTIFAATADSTILSMEYFFRKYANSRPDTLYLYIDNINTSQLWQETLWRDIWVTAVFTNTQ